MSRQRSPTVTISGGELGQCTISIAWASNGEPQVPETNRRVRPVSRSSPRIERLRNGSLTETRYFARNLRQWLKRRYSRNGEFRMNPGQPLTLTVIDGDCEWDQQSDEP